MNEVEALARKAARGAGFSWGLAEEAGRAVRWLASVSLPGPETLATRLERGSCGTPLIKGAVWTAEAGPLCPLIAGAALADRAEAVAYGDGGTLRQVAEPLLLVPFVAAIAAQTGTALRVDWPEGAFAFAADARGASVSLTGPADVRVSAGTGPDLPLLACQLRYVMPAATSDLLAAYAHRTYAPDTEASRLSGAGAGLSDND